MAGLCDETPDTATDRTDRKNRVDGPSSRSCSASPWPRCRRRTSVGCCACTRNRRSPMRNACAGLRCQAAPPRCYAARPGQGRELVRDVQGDHQLIDPRTCEAYLFRPERLPHQYPGSAGRRLARASAQEPAPSRSRSARTARAVERVNRCGTRALMPAHRFSNRRAIVLVRPPDPGASRGFFLARRCRPVNDYLQSRAHSEAGPGRKSRLP